MNGCNFIRVFFLLSNRGFFLLTIYTSRICTPLPPLPTPPYTHTHTPEEVHIVRITVVPYIGRRVRETDNLIGNYNLRRSHSRDSVLTRNDKQNKSTGKEGEPPPARYPPLSKQSTESGNDFQRSKNQQLTVSFYPG